MSMTIDELMVYVQNGFEYAQYLIFLLAALLGSRVAQGFSFWKW